MSCYLFNNRVVFEFVIFDMFIIIRVVFGLTNTVDDLLLLAQPADSNCDPKVYSSSSFIAFSQILLLS